MRTGACLTVIELLSGTAESPGAGTKCAAIPGNLGAATLPSKLGLPFSPETMAFRQQGEAMRGWRRL